MLSTVAKLELTSTYSEVRMLALAIKRSVICPENKDVGNAKANYDVLYSSISPRLYFLLTVAIILNFEFHRLCYI